MRAYPFPCGTCGKQVEPSEQWCTQRGRELGQVALEKVSTPADYPVWEEPA